MQIQYLSSRELLTLSDHAMIVNGVVVAMPYTDHQQANSSAQLMASRSGAPGLVLCIADDQGLGFIELINQAFAKTQSAYFAYVAQDAFAGRDWLSLGLNALGESKHFLGFNDGKWAGALAGFGLARSSWAKQNYGGVLFYPQYRQHYADAELTLIAMQKKVYAYDPNSILIEVDWVKDRSQVNKVDHQLFQERKKSGFDGQVSDQQLLSLIT